MESDKTKKNEDIELMLFKMEQVATGRPPQRDSPHYNIETLRQAAALLDAMKNSRALNFRALISCVLADLYDSDDVRYWLDDEGGELKK